MRSPLLAAMLALAVLIPINAQAQNSVERPAVRRVIMAFADGIHTGALGEIDQLFAPSGVHILVDNEALHGWADFRAQLLEPETAGYSGLRYAHTGIETSLRGNIAWTAFRWQMSGSGETPAPILGRATAVLEKIDGQWMIAHLHFSR